MIYKTQCVCHLLLDIYNTILIIYFLQEESLEGKYTLNTIILRRRSPSFFFCDHFGADGGARFGLNRPPIWTEVRSFFHAPPFFENNPPIFFWEAAVFAPSGDNRLLTTSFSGAMGKAGFFFFSAFTVISGAASVFIEDKTD